MSQIQGAPLDFVFSTSSPYIEDFSPNQENQQNQNDYYNGYIDQQDL
jgi:hypothetical protein